MTQSSGGTSSGGETEPYLKTVRYVAHFGRPRAERRRSISQLSFRPAPLLPTTEALVDAFRGVVNRGATGCTLHIEGMDATVRCWLLSDEQEEDGWVYGRQVLFSAGARAGLPDVYADIPAGIGPAGFSYTEPIYFERVPALLLEGQLANELHQGGPYSGPRMPAGRAAGLARASFADLIEDYEQLSVLKTTSPWCSYATHTWLITDVAAQTVTVLCLSDDD